MRKHAISRVPLVFFIFFHIWTLEIFGLSEADSCIMPFLIHNWPVYMMIPSSDNDKTRTRYSKKYVYSISDCQNDNDSPWESCVLRCTLHHTCPYITHVFKLFNPPLFSLEPRTYLRTKLAHKQASIGQGDRARPQRSRLGRLDDKFCTTWGSLWCLWIFCWPVDPEHPSRSWRRPTVP